MTIEYLLLAILIANYREEIMALAQKKQDEPEDYWRDVADALICDAPKPRPHLRIVK